jgi:hypothetical protein
MKRLALVPLLATLGLLSACGDSTGSGPSPWIGAWDLQLANGPGWIVSPAASVVSLHDSSGHLYAVTPPTFASDSGYTDPVNFAQAYAVPDGATAPDSIVLGVSGQGTNLGFTWVLRFAGTRSGNSAAGLITLESPGIATRSTIGTWTAVKR